MQKVFVLSKDGSVTVCMESAICSTVKASLTDKYDVDIPLQIIVNEFPLNEWSVSFNAHGFSIGSIIRALLFRLSACVNRVFLVWFISSVFFHLRTDDRVFRFGNLDI